MAFWTFVNNSLLGGVAGAALTVGLMELVSWLRRPRLHLEFIPGEEGYLTESTHDENGVRVTRKYLRVRLTVKGTTAKNCRIYLASVRPVVEQKVQADWLIDSRQLSWPPYNDFAARDIPQGLNMFVNLTTRNAAEEEWRFEIEHSFGECQNS